MPFLTAVDMRDPRIEQIYRDALKEFRAKRDGLLDVFADRYWREIITRAAATDRVMTTTAATADPGRFNYEYWRGPRRLAPFPAHAYRVMLRG